MRKEKPSTVESPLSGEVMTGAEKIRMRNPALRVFMYPSHTFTIGLYEVLVSEGIQDFIFLHSKVY
jgi:hypothetical protein